VKSKIEQIKQIFYYHRHKSNLDFYLDLIRRDIPLPKEWIEDAEKLAKTESDWI
jgi:hypothetical protein